MSSMLPSSTHITLQHSYQCALERYLNDGIIDIDERLKLKYDYAIHRIEDVLTKMNGVLPPAKQSAYYIILVRAGKGVKNIGDFSFPIIDNTLFFVPNRVVHSSLYEPTNFAGYALLFDIEFFLKTCVPKHAIINRKIFKTTIQPYIYLKNDQALALSRIFEIMLTEQTMTDTDRCEMMAVKILELLISCDFFFTEAGLTGERHPFHPLIEKFNELLDSKFRIDKRVQFYADSLNVHATHLNFLLKKHNGLNAKECINKKVISESKYLLTYSNFIIKEIANMLGFDDPNNFSTFFQKSTGVSPMSYRHSSTGVSYKPSVIIQDK